MPACNVHLLAVDNFEDLTVQDVPGLGLPTQQVNVQHGFARNWLIPQGLAKAIPVQPDRHPLRLRSAKQQVYGLCILTEDMRARPDPSIVHAAQGRAVSSCPQSGPA